MTKEEIVEKFLKFAEENPAVMADMLAGLAEGLDSGKITREEIFKQADEIYADADAIRAAVEPVLDEALRIGSAELTRQSVLQAAAESIEANSAEYVPPSNPLDHWGEEHWDAITALFKSCEEFFEAAENGTFLDTEADNILEGAQAMVRSGAVDILKEWTPIKDRWKPSIHYKVGDLVQVRFKIDPPIDGCEAERMWVRVTRVVDGQRASMGILDNDPVIRTDLKAGDEVGFYIGDVLGVWKD